jgi:amphi-Trp domain-containing protein
MDESREEAMVSEGQTAPAAGAAGDALRDDVVRAMKRAVEVAGGTAHEAGATAGPEESGEDASQLEALEVEIEQTLTRTQIVSRLKAIVLELEGGSLVVGGVPVAELADEVGFELEYCEKDGKHELEIEIEW